MSKPQPQVTITLGRSGQKVVKRPRATSDGARTDSQPLSGSKRSMGEKFQSNAGTSMNKRLRGNVNTRSPRYNRLENARLGRNDLRLKLMRKRISTRIQHEVEERKKMELREKMSRTIQAPKGPERSLLRHLPPTERAGELLMMDPYRFYSSRTLDGLKPMSPDRVVQASRRVSPPGNLDQVRLLSKTPIDASRTGGLFGGDVLGPSRPKGPAAITMRATIDADKSGGMPKSSYLVEQPLTVTSLLHSLGLGKYAVQFQAEEVDMTALKQMGDCDLKDLGIPMGPRKKILFAIMPRPKKQQM